MTKEKKLDYEVDEGNIFAAIGRKDADELVARSELLDEVGNLVEKSGLTQHEVAKKLGIKQSKVSMLVNGHLSEFSTDTLLHYLAVLGCRVEIRIRKPQRQNIFSNRGCIAVC
ncbi:MAG: helix-turn-helix transcriptional regulator [Rhabdochlamydiaceae bacterium]|jgi:predicted XRE-type DNA-binding protein